MAQPNATGLYGEKNVSDETQLGLCSTCNNMTMCVDRSIWKGPKVYCEQFDDYVLPKPNPNTQESKSEEATLASGDETCTYRGLCVNCENRTTCCFDKPEGGVWHCEEYR